MLKLYFLHSHGGHNGFTGTVHLCKSKITNLSYETFKPKKLTETAPHQCHCLSRKLKIQIMQKEKKNFSCTICFQQELIMNIHTTDNTLNMSPIQYEHTKKAVPSRQPADLI